MNMSYSQDLYGPLPKVELHLHLDCSLSFEVVQQLNPSIDKKTYLDSFVAPSKCTDLADYISRAIKGFELMQSKEALKLVTLDLFKQLKKDNVIYAEIRFAPLQHIYKGLTPYEVVEAVNEATTEGVANYGIECGVILCTLRHYSEQQSLETVALVDQFKGTKVVGFDIAADEAGFPIDNHIKAFEFANSKQINCTAHAGEAKGATSVWETLHQFKPKRIGHGVRSIEDEELIKYLVENNIHLEVCPTSNIQTNVFDKIQSHPIDKLYQKGVSLSVNTDARTISNVTLASEYMLLKNQFNWNKANFLRCNLNALDHAFLNPAIKESLKQRILKEYQ